MIWAVPVKSLGRFSTCRETERNSVLIYCIGEKQQPLLFFGIIPTNLCTRSGYIWVKVVGDLPLRKLRQHFASFLAELGWDLFAFCSEEDNRAQRFAQFFGLRKSSEIPGYVFYKGLH